MRVPVQQGGLEACPRVTGGVIETEAMKQVPAIFTEYVQSIIVSFVAILSSNLVLRAIIAWRSISLNPFSEYPVSRDSGKHESHPKPADALLVTGRQVVIRLMIDYVLNS